MKNADFNPICQILHHTSTKLSKTVNHNFCSSIFKSNPVKNKNQLKKYQNIRKTSFSDGIPLTKCTAMKDADFNPICQILHHASTKLSKSNSKNSRTSEKSAHIAILPLQNCPNISHTPIINTVEKSNSKYVLCFPIF
jgi:hypothetical protein